jgi:hypothetical protein
MMRTGAFPCVMMTPVPILSAMVCCLKGRDQRPGASFGAPLRGSDGPEPESSSPSPEVISLTYCDNQRSKSIEELREHIRKQDAG